MKTPCRMRTMYLRSRLVPMAMSTPALSPKWRRQKHPKERGVWKPGETSSICVALQKNAIKLSTAKLSINIPNKICSQQGQPGSNEK